MKAMVDEKGKKEAGGGKAVEPARPRPSVMEFLAQVRQEVLKVTWPTRTETITSTVAVFIMLAMAAVFFMLVDFVLGWVITHLMNLV
jgi:preprotein translocase subunit SecE